VSVSEFEYLEGDNLSGANARPTDELALARGGGGECRAGEVGC